MKKAKIIITSFLIILLVIIFFFLCNTFDFKHSQNIKTNEEEEIVKLKNAQGISGKNELYEVVNITQSEKTLAVKENVKFRVALVGMIKDSKPKLEELDDIIKDNSFKRTGIYVNEKSRKKFLDLINKYAIGKYEFDTDGFLIKIDDNEINENDKKILKKINSNEVFIIDFSSIYYAVDDVTGEIVDIPFENMDPYQISIVYKMENQNLIFITNNIKGKITDEEIFKEIFGN